MTIDQATYNMDRPRAVDGDTVAAQLWTDRPLGYGMRQRTYSGDELGRPKEASVRLIWVDTPERNVDYAAWLDAKSDAAIWLALREGTPLRVVIFGSGGLGRLLGDVIDKDGNSLAQYQLQQGWPLWTR